MSDITPSVTELKTLEFHGHPLATFEAEGEKWVVMRPVVDGMGLNWSGQQQKLKAKASRFNCMDIHTTAMDGKQREMLCIPLRRYPKWLDSVNAEKIPDRDIRARVILFQEMSTEALYQFWTTGIATMQSVKAEVSLDRVLDAMSEQTFRQHRTAIATRQAFGEQADGIKSTVLGYLKHKVIPRQEEQMSLIMGIKAWIEDRFKALHSRDVHMIKGLEAVSAEQRQLSESVHRLITVTRADRRVTMMEALELLGVPEEHRTRELARHLSANSASGWYAERRLDWLPRGQAYNRPAAEFDTAHLRRWWDAAGEAAYKAFLAKRARRTVTELRVVT